MTGSTVEDAAQAPAVVAPESGKDELRTDRKITTNPILALLSSFGLALFSLGGLFVITLLGTLSQPEIGLFASIEKYFAVWFVNQEIVNPLRIVLPGGYLLMTLLAANIAVGGILRMRKDWRRAGVMLTHIGIALLLVGGGVESLFKKDVNIALIEGASASEARYYREWEIAVYQKLGDNGQVREWVVPATQISRLGPTGTLVIERDEWPFAVRVSSWLPNCEAVASESAGAVILDPRADEVQEPHRNMPGCRVAIFENADDAHSGTVLPAQSGLVWGLTEQPFGFGVGDDVYGVAVRRQRLPVPFTLRLDDFHRELHPRTQIARVYRSDVTLTETATGIEHQRRIEMNDPMRWGGYVLYQESFQIYNDGTEQSQFAVAKNPSDRWPILSVAIVGIGLVWHFAGLLLRHLSIERRVQALSS
jgi:hypothetical protein